MVGAAPVVGGGGSTGGGGGITGSGGRGSTCGQMSHVRI